MRKLTFLMVPENIFEINIFVEKSKKTKKFANSVRKKELLHSRIIVDSKLVTSLLIILNRTIGESVCQAKKTEKENLKSNVPKSRRAIFRQVFKVVDSDDSLSTFDVVSPYSGQQEEDSFKQSSLHGSESVVWKFVHVYFNTMYACSRNLRN